MFILKGLLFFRLYKHAAKEEEFEILKKKNAFPAQHN